MCDGSKHPLTRRCVVACLSGRSVDVRDSRRGIKVQLPLTHPQQQLDRREVFLVETLIFAKFTSSHSSQLQGNLKERAHVRTELLPGNCHVKPYIVSVATGAESLSQYLGLLARFAKALSVQFENLLLQSRQSHGRTLWLLPREVEMRSRFKSFEERLIDNTPFL
jgi:hypothetical protein